ncbi:conserved hypothetical protein [delta proteobacterium NaphS2]|nr:conserved hypothetical protein [delta proteobacterium NaphS2]
MATGSVVFGFIFCPHYAVDFSGCFPADLTQKKAVSTFGRPRLEFVKYNINPRAQETLR